MCLQALIKDDDSLNLTGTPNSDISALLALGIWRELHALGETVYVIARADHEAQWEANHVSKAGREKLEACLEASGSLPCLLHLAFAPSIAGMALKPTKKNLSFLHQLLLIDRDRCLCTARLHPAENLCRVHPACHVGCKSQHTQRPFAMAYSSA